MEEGGGRKEHSEETALTGQERSSSSEARREGAPQRQQAEMDLAEMQQGKGVLAPGGRTMA